MNTPTSNILVQWGLETALLHSLTSSKHHALLLAACLTCLHKSSTTWYTHRKLWIYMAPIAHSWNPQALCPLMCSNFQYFTNKPSPHNGTLCPSYTQQPTKLFNRVAMPVSLRPSIYVENCPDGKTKMQHLSPKMTKFCNKSSWLQNTKSPNSQFFPEDWKRNKLLPVVFLHLQESKLHKNDDTRGP